MKDGDDAEENAAPFAIPRQLYILAKYWGGSVRPLEIYFPIWLSRFNVLLK
jgi:hypothetical protein